MSENARAVLLLSALTFLAGIVFWIAPTEKTIRAISARADAARQKSVTDEHALAAEPRVRLLAQRIRGDLKGLRKRFSVGDTNQALLGDLQTAAARNRLAVTGVKPTVLGIAPPQPTYANAQASPNPFEAAQRQESEISVRGSYRDILSFLRDLSRMPTLARVLNVQLDRTTDNDLADGSPSLDAAIQLETIRLDRSIIP
jgi:Tfp pilus assembly protein PilO